MHELDGIHLRDAGFELEQVALSSSLRELAIESGDRNINEESGFPVLVRWLRDVVAAGVVGVDAAAAATLVAAVAAQLHDQLAGERDVLADPAAAEAVLADLGDAQARADRARQVASRWQQVLADGFADASADIDRDLRTRLRRLANLAEDAVDELDPATAWAEFEPWLYQEVAGSIGEHLVVRHARAGAVGGGGG